MASRLEAAPIDDRLLKAIYDRDQALHPAALPFDRLQSWRDACPELSILCKLNDEEAVGAIIAMPLQRLHWEDLLCGRLKENHVEASMFVAANSAQAQDVGVHVFHVERFEGHEAVRGIGTLATKLVQEVANKKPWNIVGYSALTASEGGRAIFGKLGFEPTGYQEVFVARTEGGSDIVYVGPHESAADSKGVEGEVESRSVMMVRRGNHHFQ